MYVEVNTPSVPIPEDQFSGQSPSLLDETNVHINDDNNAVDEPDNSDGEPVSDPELEAAAEQVDISTRFLCISEDFVDKYFPTIISISVGAYCGVGIRMLLSEFALSFHRGQSELLLQLGSGFFLPNVVGCVIMGFTVRCKTLFSARFNTYITGVTTGFCGSCTTFASWDVAVAANIVHNRWMNAFILIGVQTVCALASHRVGGQVADACIRLLSARSFAFTHPPINISYLQANLKRMTESFDGIRADSYGGDMSLLVSASRDKIATAHDASIQLGLEMEKNVAEEKPYHRQMVGWIIVATMLVLWLWIPPFVGFGTYTSSRLLALAFGPFGALLRYYLSQFNTQESCQDFPMFTFIPNVVASFLYCIIVTIGSATNRDGSAYHTYLKLGEGGLILGFCGSLSTVSTWVYEIETLSARSLYLAYRYSLVSILIAQLGSICILGLYVAYSTHPLIV